LTALAVPALSGFTGLDIPGAGLECPDKPNHNDDNVIFVEYRVVDEVFHAQSLVGGFRVPTHASVLDAAEQYERENPAAIR